MTAKIEWPGGKRFAFTVFDDTDLATLENTGPVYTFLEESGFLTTKSSWPIRGPGKPTIGGATCEDSDYLKWLQHLQRKGFEIGFHSATYHSSETEVTRRGLERFKEYFGHNPMTMANHLDCEEGMYWGNYRLTGVHELIYNLLLRFKHNGKYRGHIEGDRYFWGNICRENIKYIRNFAYGDVNTLKACPFMPYHDAARPYVNYWFASSEGPNVTMFNKCISEKNQDRLEAESGACIMYTHFAYGFYQNGGLDPRFRELMTRLGKKNGWFVPVATLLDYILEKRGRYELTRRDRSRLERKWLLHKIRVGGTT